MAFVGGGGGAGFARLRFFARLLVLVGRLVVISNSTLSQVCECFAGAAPVMPQALRSGWL